MRKTDIQTPTKALFAVLITLLALSGCGGGGGGSATTVVNAPSAGETSPATSDPVSANVTVISGKAL